MDNFFYRQVQLWGEDKQELLSTKKIAIIGSGGLGSSLAFALGASGIKEIHMVDFDEVSLHNIHRQITFKIGDEGKSKALLNVSTMLQRYPFVKAIAHNCDFLEFCKKEIELDLIIDATDNLEARSHIDEYAKSKNLPWIYGSVEAFHGQVCFFQDSSFRDAFKIATRSPAGIAAPMVMHIASLQANLALRYLVGLSLKTDLLYYLFFNNDGELVTQKFNIAKA